MLWRRQPFSEIEWIVVDFFNKHRSSCAPLAQRRLGGQDWRKIAEELGLPLDTARRRYSRCLDLLRKHVHTDPVLEALRDAWFKHP